MDAYITVGQMLEFRERKVFLREKLQRKYPGNVAVVLGMNIPGPKKSSREIRKAFAAGAAALEELFNRESVHLLEICPLEDPAGEVMLYALSCPGAAYIKKMTVSLEDTHPLGRLFDIDVYWPDGKAFGRRELGLPERKCLLCSREAKACGRNRTHSVEELQEKVHEIICRWQSEEDNS